MNTLQKTRHGALNLILESLGMNVSDVEQAAESEAYRVAFEKNLTVELQHLPDTSCRISARISRLGKSLQVQDDQLRIAMEIFTALLSDLPSGVSMAISDHDNCLRICIEIRANKPDIVMMQFNQFVHVAFACKETYLKHKND